MQEYTTPACNNNVLGTFGPRIYLKVVNAGNDDDVLVRFVLNADRDTGLWSCYL
jgi:hypothetical protein